MQFPDRIEDAVLRRLFEEIAVGARFQRFEDLFAVFIDGEHHELDGRTDGFYATDTVDAAQSRQLNIGDHDVRTDIRQRAYGVFRVVIGGKEKEVGSVGDDPLQAVSYIGNIFDNADANGCHDIKIRLPAGSPI